MEFPATDRRAHPQGAIFSSWAAPDGWPLRRFEWPAPEGEAPRGSLLFAGGRGDFIEKHLEPLGHWHALGWRTSSFDWRGQGGSRGGIEHGHVDSFEPFVADLACLVEDWRRTGPGPHVAVAHSMGAHLLLRLLASRDIRVDAAVLVSPMIEINSSPIPPPVARLLAGAMARLGFERAPAWRQEGMPPYGSRRQRFLTACPDRYSDEQWWREREPDFGLGAPTWGWLRAAYRSAAELTAGRLASIRTPLLFIGTETDRLVSARAIRRAAAAVPGAGLLMFPRTGHEILREADTVRIEALDRIDSFFDGKAPR
jgi:lysophospholipase